MRKQIVSLIRICVLLLFIVLLAGCWVKNIETPYYTQETNYYCGAASAQMILNSDKIHTYVAQNTLYTYIHSHNQCTGWATDPKGLRDVLNNYYPSGHFIVHTPSVQLDGVKKLAYTVDRYGVPPAALIYGAMHWVVVRGVITDNQPTTAASYTIYGFYVNDPWYGTNSLGENRYVDIASWNSDYFTGTNAWCGASDSIKYISVVDPDPLSKVRVIYPKPLLRREKIISPTEIQQIAQKYIKEFNTRTEVKNKFAFADRTLRISVVGTPTLVTRSDQRLNAYYIVPLQQNQLTAGVLLIDAYSGQFKEISLVTKPLNYNSILNRDKAQELFRSKVGTFKSNGNTIDPKTLKITKMELAWEPSSQSQSPYYPLWRVEGSTRTGEASRFIGYMDHQGRIFASLSRNNQLGGGR